DAARPLSEIRDGKVLVEAFDALVKGAPPRERAGLQGIREGLVAHQFRVRRQAARAAALEPAARMLRSARARADGWSLNGAGWKALAAGVRRVYQSGRDALALAQVKPTDGNLHELRKQAKYLWQQLEILKPIAPRRIGALAKGVHDLSDGLGED